MYSLECFGQSCLPSQRARLGAWYTEMKYKPITEDTIYEDREWKKLKLIPFTKRHTLSTLKGNKCHRNFVLITGNLLQLKYTSRMGAKWRKLTLPKHKSWMLLKKNFSEYSAALKSVPLWFWAWGKYNAFTYLLI